MEIKTFLEAYHTHIFIWLGLAFLAIILETFVRKHVIGLWFAVSAAFSMLLALMHLKFTIQFIAFFVVSVIFILIDELYFKKISKG
ncbi:MAG: hypothetical protein J1F31_03600 [Erysipelotrichales bacterium]|nr:hypothetical protein [Erysipelotrichales bacterium]